MYRYIALMIIWVALLFSCRIFLPLRKSVKKYYWLLFIVLLILIFIASFLLPVSMFGMASFFSPLIMILPCVIFYKGDKILKGTVLIAVYLGSLVADAGATLIGFLFQHFFTDSIVTGNIVATGELNALFFNDGIFLACLLVFYTNIFPKMKKCMEILTPDFFSHFAGPFLLTYLVSNGIISLIYVESFLSFLGGSLIFFLFVVIMMRYAMRSFRIFLLQENERTKLILQRDCLEQQAEHSKELAEKYSEIRKENHDISNHLCAVSYLIESKRWEEAQKYIETLLKEKKEEL